MPRTLAVAPIGLRPYGCPPIRDLSHRGEDFTRWPDVSRQLPTQTPDLLANSSQTTPPLPPPRQRAPIQAQIIRYHQIRAEELRIESNREEEREAEKRRAAASKAADYSYGKLLELYSVLPLRKQLLRARLSTYETEDLAGFAVFFKHVLDAHVVSEADVRVYDIIRWYKAIPTYVRDPLLDLIEHYHREAIVRQSIKKSEIEAGTWHDPQSVRRSENDEVYAAGPTGNGQEHFGYEHSQLKNGFGDYRPRFEGALQLKHLAASLRVRKVRLQYLDRRGKLPKMMWDLGLEKQLHSFAVHAKNHIKKGIEGVSKDDRLLLEVRKSLNRIHDRYKAFLCLYNVFQEQRKVRRAKWQDLEAAKKDDQTERYAEIQVEVMAIDDGLKGMAERVKNEAERIGEAGDLW